jgi:hypothetical protein
LKVFGSKKTKGQLKYLEAISTDVEAIGTEVEAIGTDFIAYFAFLATSIFRPFVFLLPKTFNDKTLKYC